MSKALVIVDPSPESKGQHIMSCATETVEVSEASEAADATQFDALGKIAWLWMNSPLHADWTMRLAARFLLPAIAAGQYHLIERDGMPVAYCSWAWLDAQAELAYIVDPSRVLADDWHSGERLWFIDWVAPFSATDSWTLRRAMMRRFPDEVARAIRVKRDRTTARVMEFKGPQLDSQSGHARLKSYYDSFLTIAQNSAQAHAIRARSRAAADNNEETNHAG